MFCCYLASLIMTCTLVLWVLVLATTFNTTGLSAMLKTRTLRKITPLLKPKFLVITRKLNCSDGKISDTNINADGKTTEDAFEDDKEEASRNSDMEDKFSDMEDESKGNEEDLEFEF